MPPIIRIQAFIDPKEQKMPQEAVQYLPLEKIVCLDQVRDKVQDESLIGLARSIQEIGLQQPIRVRRDGERFVPIDGERRLRAARLAKLSVIAVIIESKDLNEGEIIQRQLIANIQRVDLAPLEKARSIARLMESAGWNGAEAAGHLGLSTASVARLIALLSLPEPIKAQVASGQIPPSTAYEIAKIDDPVKQLAFAEDAANGRLTRDAISGCVKQQRASTPPQEQAAPSRVSADLGGGRSVTVSGIGLTLDVLIGWLEELLAKARKARTQGIELKTFVKRLRDQAKATA